jgi:hypothetical protein
MTANINTENGLAEIPIERFVIIEGIKCFVHKNFTRDYYVVSEYTSGFSFKSFGVTVEEAIANAIDKIKKVGAESFMERVNKVISEHGIANTEATK